MKFYYPTTLIIGFFVAIALPALAAEDFTLHISPKNPGPNETVEAEVISFEFDTHRAQIRWFANNKEISSGVGRTIEHFTMGSTGSTFTIKALVTANRTQFQNTVTFHINDIDLMVNARTYTPIFYRGASLPTPGSVVEIYAVPHMFSGGKKVSPQNLVYEWTVDETVSDAQSGGGKNKLILPLNDIRNREVPVNVRVSTFSGQSVGTKSIVVRTVEPKVLFYGFSELVGIKPIAGQAFTVSAGERASIVGEPYFISNESLSAALLRWEAEGEVVALNTSNPRLLTIQVPVEGGRRTTFSFSLKDPRHIFQEVEESLTIEAKKSQ